ncbi:hypothetical protein RhiirA5_407509 [Rhizophagus irregularis]|uniref:Uncharacterized protein n=1 Tax=Rhizophagus irregularis TaxID=588596 RepID=A0A2N0QA97_9GLOM|nr:hypothetical protein RhiirA5_407509 [Rhizophagus irregularis]
MILLECGETNSEKFFENISENFLQILKYFEILEKLRKSKHKKVAKLCDENDFCDIVNFRNF